MSLVSCNDNMEKPVILENYKDLLSVKDLSEILSVSKQTAYREIKNGKFGEPLKFGREYRIPKIYILQRYFHYKTE